MYLLRLSCSPEAVDFVSSQLWEAGTLGVHELDYERNVVLRAGFDTDHVSSVLLQKFRDYSPEWRFKELEDWTGHTETAWPPRAIGKRLTLAAPWQSVLPTDGRLTIVHNPGQASGTGEHPCTQLALVALEDAIKPMDRVADVGTGSGVIAIAALRLEASVAIGLDIDRDSLLVAEENYQLNGLHADLIQGSADTLASEQFDIVVANISGTVLLSMFDDLIRIAKPNGRLILTGFTDAESKVFEDLLPGATIYEQGEWRCVSGALQASQNSFLAHA